MPAVTPGGRGTTPQAGLAAPLDVCWERWRAPHLVLHRFDVAGLDDLAWVGVQDELSPIKVFYYESAATKGLAELDFVLHEEIVALALESRVL